MEYKIRKIDYYDKNTIYNFSKKLYSEKKEKVKKLKIISKKYQSIIGDIILKELLDGENIIYDNLSFVTNEYGKPYIKNNSIFFNISHSYEYIITTISKKEIGVDIEKIRPTTLNIISRFATDKEKAYILSKHDNIEKRIFEIYSLKEAYFKMMGNNLDNIKNVEFIIENRKITCSNNNICAFFINDLDDYVIAVCEKIN